MEPRQRALGGGCGRVAGVKLSGSYGVSLTDLAGAAASASWPKEGIVSRIGTIWSGTQD
jgi:hypothetical protein